MHDFSPNAYGDAFGPGHRSAGKALPGFRSHLPAGRQAAFVVAHRESNVLAELRLQLHLDKENLPPADELAFPRATASAS